MNPSCSHNKYLYLYPAFRGKDLLATTCYLYKVVFFKLLHWKIYWRFVFIVYKISSSFRNFWNHWHEWIKIEWYEFEDDTNKIGADKIKYWKGCLKCTIKMQTQHRLMSALYLEVLFYMTKPTKKKKKHYFLVIILMKIIRFRRENF